MPLVWRILEHEVSCSWNLEDCVIIKYNYVGIGNLAQDFVPIVRTITIPADEGIAGAPPVLDIPVPILIVDDAVDEPALEYFIASLSIASSNIRPGAVVMNQSASLCVIADDDRKLLSNTA